MKRRDESAVYLAWMPEGCQLTASALVGGIIEGVCTSSDIRCSVSVRKEGEREGSSAVEYLVEMTLEEAQRWERK